MGYRNKIDYSYEQQIKARRRAERRRLVMMRRALVVSVAILLLTFVLFFIFVITRVNRHITIEAGDILTTELLRHYNWDKGKISFVTEPESTTATGKYACKVFATLFEYKVTVEVKDTTAPTAEGIRVVGVYGETPSPDKFLINLKDAAPCTVTWVQEPDATKYGIQSVVILLTDQAGNQTKVSAELMIPNAKTELTVEAGSTTPTVEQFLMKEGSEIQIVSDSADIDTKAVGTYPVTLLVDGTEVEAVVQVVDTTAPTAITKNWKLYLNKPKKAEEFISSVSDMSEVEITFLEEPDWGAEGEQTVVLLLTDVYGNQGQAEANLTLLRDTGVPDIQVSDIDVVVGGVVSYKKAVNYCDDIDTKDEMTLTIDRTGVDLNTEGSYTVTYTVTDCSGNSVSATGKVNVLAQKPEWTEEEKIHAKADEVLASILTDDMTLEQKAKKIYRWLKNNIGYISHSEKGDYMRGAYEGLFKKQGDCFVYAATAKELLTRAGIENMDIVKKTVNPSHYWNLVNLGEGWYHFDATPRKDKSEFFLLTDAQLEAYSVAHKNSHNFDRSLYPEIQ